LKFGSAQNWQIASMPIPNLSFVRSPRVECLFVKRQFRPMQGLVDLL
jgi:hypothetical protein